MSKTKTLEVSKSQAIALLVALGFKTAKRMNCKKLTEKLNAIEEVPGEPMETEELDALIDELMNVDEAIVIEDEEEIDEDIEDVDTFDEDSDNEEDTEDVDDDEDTEDADDEEEEEVKPKKGKKDKKAKEEDKPKPKPKTKTKIKEQSKERKTRTKGKSMDSVTMDLLKKKPITMEVLVKAVAKEFPEADEEVLTRITKRRVTGHLQKKYNVTITKSKKGAYSIEE